MTAQILFLKKVFIFALILGLFLMIYYQLVPLIISSIEETKLNTENQIRLSFSNVKKKTHKMMIFGNSAIVRGINPEFLSISAYNFGHDNDGFNQMFYKLQYLINNSIDFKYVILGVTINSFNIFSDSRNYVYKKYFAPSYMDDYSISDINKTVYWFISIKFQQTLPYFTEFLKIHLFNFKNSKKRNINVLDNGHFIIQETKNNGDIPFRRDTSKLQLQIKYFIKILEFAEDNDKALVILIPPMKQNEIRLYSKYELDDFVSYLLKLTNNKIIILNYPEKYIFSDSLFYDQSHLNETGAILFTQMLNKEVEEIFENTKICDTIINSCLTDIN